MTAWHDNPFTGLFTRFGAMPVRPHDPDTAIASGVAATSQDTHAASTGSGIGWTAAAAEGACIGEAIERLQAAPLPDDATVRARFDAWPLAEPAIHPGRWVLFHPEQYRQAGFPFQPFDSETECAWVCFRNAATGEPAWIPAELAYLHWPQVRQIGPGYSTGLACGRDGDPIVLRGLQEVIERDAVVGAWWNRYPLTEVHADGVLTSLPPEIGVRVRRPNLTYRFFRVDTPYSAHVTMVTIEGEDREGFVFSIGASCRETRDLSWEKSLLEAIHGRHYARYLKSQVVSGALAIGRSPCSYADHAVWYSLYPDMLQGTVLRSARPPENEHTDFAEREPLDRLMERLGPEYAVLFRSMTPPSLASAQLGWHVVRVAVPGMQPLHGHHELPHLGGSLWSPRHRRNGPGGRRTLFPEDWS